MYFKYLEMYSLLIEPWNKECPKADDDVDSINVQVARAMLVKCLRLSPFFKITYFKICARD